VGTLADEAWTEFCTIAAAAKLIPDTEARARLTTILFEQYPAFRYNRERVAASFRRAEKMLRHLDAFAELYREHWLPDLPYDQFRAVITCPASVLTTDKTTEAHFWYLLKLRLRVEQLWSGAQALRHAHARRYNAQREWLFAQLSFVWLHNFQAPDLTYTVPSLGGPPEGPLIAFMLAAMRQVMSEPPSAETIRNGIDRVRRELETAKQLSFALRERGAIDRLLDLGQRLRLPK
jgi:hypothetical protein